jgi:hypothetical protein
MYMTTYCLRRVMLLLGIIATSLNATAALSPSDTPDITLKLAGSTIWDNNTLAVLNNLCVSNTLSTFVDADPKGKGTYWKAYFCQINSAQVPGLSLSNPKVLILKRNKNGMITGVVPMLETTKPIQFMGISNSGQCVLSAGSSTAYTCRTTQSGDLINYTPDMGLHDIDAFLTRDANFTPVIDGNTYKEPIADAILSNLTMQNAGGVIQNTPVSKNLRDALQAAQVGEGTLPSSCVGAETLACMPSLTTDFLSRVFAGKIQDWGEVIRGGLPMTSYSKAQLDTTKVAICRRNRGASTQMAVNEYFLRNPCDAQGTVPVEISNNVTGPIVVAPGQVSEEEKCLDDFSQGTNNLGLNPAAQHIWAIGMLTTERNTTLAYNYRYIKIDGYEPSPQQVFNGNYKYFGEASFVWRKAPPMQLAGDALVLVQKLATAMTTPQLFGTLNAKITEPWGTGAFIATSGQGYQAGTTFDASNPVTPWTHQLPGNQLNNCQALINNP